MNDFIGTVGDEGITQTAELKNILGSQGKKKKERREKKRGVGENYSRRKKRKQ